MSVWRWLNRAIKKLRETWREVAGPYDEDDML